MRGILRRLKLCGSVRTRQASVPLFLFAACQAEERDALSGKRKEPMKFYSSGELSHETLIRQACSLTVHSSSQLITQVLVAITDTSKDYREAMSRLMTLLENSIIYLSNSTSPFQNDIEDMIVAQRNTVDDHRKAIMELVSLMDYVEKMVTSTAETAFLAGAEQSSTLMCERLNSALEKVDHECAINKSTEEELLKLQQMYVLRLHEASENESQGKGECNEHKNEEISNIDAHIILNHDIFDNNVDENTSPS